MSSPSRRRYSPVPPLAVAMLSAVLVLCTAPVQPAGAAPFGWQGAVTMTSSSIASFSTSGAVATMVSCSSYGNCSAVGNYYDGSATQVFAIDETNGVWGSAVELLGPLPQFGGGLTDAVMISCSSAGNCSASGFYFGPTGPSHTFVVNEVNGVWGALAPVTSALTNFSATFNTPIAISCTASGACSMVGAYYNGSGLQPYVVDEVGGVWGGANAVASLDANLTTHSGLPTSLSCSSAGNCAAAGYYDNAPYRETYVLNETNGVWGSATQVTSSAPGFTTGSAQINAVACRTAGSCVAAGSYNDGSYVQPFIVSETAGVWGGATEITSGLTGFNSNQGQATNVSCSSAVDCSVAGTYSDGVFTQPFVINEVSGVWGVPSEVTSSIVGFNTGVTMVGSMSCTSPGYCSLVGRYYTPTGFQAFTLDEIKGSWGNASQLTSAIAGFNSDNVGTYSISCSSPGECATVGGYSSGSVFNPFVANETSPPRRFH